VTMWTWCEKKRKSFRFTQRPCEKGKGKGFIHSGWGRKKRGEWVVSCWEMKNGQTQLPGIKRMGREGGGRKALLIRWREKMKEGRLPFPMQRGVWERK